MCADRSGFVILNQNAFSLCLPPSPGLAPSKLVWPCDQSSPFTDGGDRSADPFCRLSSSTATVASFLHLWWLVPALNPSCPHKLLNVLECHHSHI